MALPLEGIRILDLTRLLPGPFGTLLLADMGADVIKVEDPGLGDYLRMSPPHASSGMSVHFHTINRNKRSIGIDLKRKEGQELLLRMARDADVLVEQFRPGVMERMGLGYQTVREANPAIVYCSITGYGQDGPYRDSAGHDANYLGYAGVLNSIGAEGGPPLICGVQIADLGAGGMYAALSILTAYVHAQKTREGQHVDVSMLDGSVSWLTINTGELFLGGDAPERGTGLLWGYWPCYSVCEAADGYMAIGALEGKFWARLCEVLGRPDYAEQQFCEEKREEIFAWLRETFIRKTRSEWMEIFGSEDVCVTPVLSQKEMTRDPQVLHRRMVVEVDDEKLGRSMTLGIPVKYSATPGEIRSSAPLLGEQTDEVLSEFGCTGAEIEGLRSAGIVC